MMLKFTIDKQHISRSDCETPVEKSRHYLFARFDFISDEWNDIDKYVTFHNTSSNVSKSKLIVDGQVEVPWEVITAGAVEVSCFGGDLITNDTCKFFVRKSGYNIAPDSEEATPTLIEQMIAKLDDSSKKISVLKSFIEVQNEAISAKANQESLDNAVQTINNAITAVNESIVTLQTAITNKVSNTDFENFKTFAEKTHNTLEGLSSDIKNSLNDWIKTNYENDKKQTQAYIEAVEQSLSDIKTILSSKASSDELDALSTLTESVSQKLTDLENIIPSKANKSEIRKLAADVWETIIDNQTLTEVGEIDLKSFFAEKRYKKLILIFEGNGSSKGTKIGDMVMVNDQRNTDTGYIIDTTTIYTDIVLASGNQRYGKRSIGYKVDNATQRTVIFINCEAGICKAEWTKNTDCRESVDACSMPPAIGVAHYDYIDDILIMTDTIDATFTGSFTMKGVEYID